MFEKLLQIKEMITQLVVCYNYFKNYYKMIAIDLSKQQAFDADPKTMEQINFAANLQQQATIFFIVEEAKETISDFSQGTVKV